MDICQSEGSPFFSCPSIGPPFHDILRLLGSCIYNYHLTVRQRKRRLSKKGENSQQVSQKTDVSNVRKSGAGDKVSRHRMPWGTLRTLGTLPLTWLGIWIFGYLTHQAQRLCWYFQLQCLNNSQPSHLLLFEYTVVHWPSHLWIFWCFIFCTLPLPGPHMFVCFYV